MRRGWKSPPSRCCSPGQRPQSRHISSVPIVSKSFVVVALQLFGNEFIFELTNLFGGKNRILRAWDHPPSRRLSFFVPFIEHDRTAFFEFLEHFPGRLQALLGSEARVSKCRRPASSTFL